MRGLCLDWYERRGFSECAHGWRLRCNPPEILFYDHPILWRLSPVLNRFRRWDVVAFAAELLQLGYCNAVVSRTAECGITVVRRLRAFMVQLGFELRRRVKIIRKPHWATFSSEYPPRKPPMSGHKGVYWNAANKRWVVQRNIDGKVRHFGAFVEKELAIARSLEVFPQYGSRRIYADAREHGIDAE